MVRILRRTIPCCVSIIAALLIVFFSDDFINMILRAQDIKNTQLKSIKQNKNFKKFIEPLQKSSETQKIIEQPKSSREAMHEKYNKPVDFFEEPSMKTPPNPDFIFHNKMPKSGSTTMHFLLRKLARKHKFKYIKVNAAEVTAMKSEKVEGAHNAHLVVDDLMNRIKKELKVIAQNVENREKNTENKGGKNKGKNEKLFIIMHHYTMNSTFFKEHLNTSPTLMNVIRHPVDHFQSQYYFRRIGRGMDKHRMSMDKYTEKEKNTTIDECVKTRLPECTHLQPNPYNYLGFLCGETDLKSCEFSSELHRNDDSMRGVVDRAKKMITDQYYLVGILEKYDLTLKLLEKMLPDYFGGVYDLSKTESLLEKKHKTATKEYVKMSEESRGFLREGPLKYEMEIYEFAVRVFEKKLADFGLEL